MKGFLASQASTADGTYSDLQVLQSPAGHYIGTIFHNHAGYDEPGSRESEYFEDRASAEAALANKSWNQRSHP